MNRPKVSVIMPSLNVAKYIGECIESAINQTLKDIEIICVDAGSTDGTLEILEEYAARDSRIKLLKSPVKSYGAQMNMGFAAATGEFMAILETDDYILPETYEELYAIAQENNLDFVKSDFERFVGDTDNRSFVYIKVSYKDLYGTIISSYENIEAFDAVMNTWTGLYRMSFLQQYGILHNETPGASYQDNGFWFQTFMYATRMMFVNKAYYKLRRDNPASSVYSKGKVYTIFEEYDFIEKILLSKPEYIPVFMGMFCKKKYDNCIYHYNRIATEFRREYLARMQAEFSSAAEKGYLSEKLFDREKWKELNMIISNPDRFYSLTNGEYTKKLYGAYKKVCSLFSYVSNYGIGAAVDKVRTELRIRKQR